MLLCWTQKEAGQCLILWGLLAYAMILPVQRYAHIVWAQPHSHTATACYNLCKHTTLWRHECNRKIEPLCTHALHLHKVSQTQEIQGLARSLGYQYPVSNIPGDDLWSA